MVNRRECSIGAALLCVACGVGDLFKCVRPYHVDAFKTWPYLLADEMYMDSHCIELDNTLELVYIMEAYYGIHVRFSGASREDSEDAAFDIILEKSDDPHCPILMLRERDVVIEIKNEHAKLLRKKLRAGHGRAEVESDSESEKKGEEKDPGDEEKPKGRPVRADKVDVTISFRPTRRDKPTMSLFGPGRSEAAAVVRHKRQELIDEYRAKDATLSLEEAMRRAAEEMWKTPSYRYKGVVCAAAHLYDDDPQPSHFNVDPDLEQDVKTAIANAFNTEIARNDKAMGGKHDGEAEHAIKKLDAAELPDLREAKSKLVAAIDKANGDVVTPHGAPWAGLVLAIEAEAADAETAKADALLPKASDRAFFTEWDRRTDELCGQDLEELRKRIDHKLRLAADAEQRVRDKKKRAPSDSEAAPKKKRSSKKKK